MIVLASKLVDVPLQMLWGNLVEGSLVRPLQHGPEALNPVGMRHAVDVFGNAVLDRFVRVGDAFICRRIIGIDDRICSNLQS